MTRRPDHLSLGRLEAWLDQDLPAAEAALAREHLAACAACRGEEAQLLAVRAELDRLVAPEPPAFFDTRILASLPAPSEALLWIRNGARLYGATAAALLLGWLGALVVAGPARVETAVAGGITNSVEFCLNAMTAMWGGFVNFMKTAGDLIPVADTVASLFRGLDTAAAALAPHVILSLTLTMLLAVLVLVWASSEPRRTGVPHVHLVL